MYINNTNHPARQVNITIINSLINLILLNFGKCAADPDEHFKDPKKNKRISYNGSQQHNTNQDIHRLFYSTVGMERCGTSGDYKYKERDGRKGYYGVNGRE